MRPIGTTARCSRVGWVRPTTEPAHPRQASRALPPPRSLPHEIVLFDADRDAETGPRGSWKPGVSTPPRKSELEPQFQHGSVLNEVGIELATDMLQPESLVSQHQVEIESREMPAIAGEKLCLPCDVQVEQFRSGALEERLDPLQGSVGWVRCELGQGLELP